MDEPKFTILIVDDEPLTIRVLTDLLSSEYRVKAANSPRRALEILSQAEKPDLVLLDIMMPELTGFDIIRQMKRDPALEAIPVIFVTAVDDSGSEVAGFELGAMDYVTKPIVPVVVRARVRTHLSLHHHQRELEQQKERFSMATKAGNLGLWEYNLCKDQILVTREVLTMGNHDPAVMLDLEPDGKWGVMRPDATSLRDMVHPDDIEEYSRLMDAHLGGQLDSFRFEYRALRADGSYMWILNTSSVVAKNADGVPEKCVGVLADIDQLKTLQMNLSIAKGEAETATHAKADFLAKMTHEIRTPLNSVMGLIHLALKTRDAEVRSRHLLTVQRTVDYIVRIVNDILDFSKIEAGAMTLEVTPFELDGLFGQCEELLSIPAEQKDISLTFSIAPELDNALMGDPHRLEQILINLANNAIKFTDKGGDVAISATVCDGCDVHEGQCGIQFDVQDNGIGITEEQQSHLFQSYSQASTSTARQYGGTGLGLVVSQQLVQLMGGEIWVNSEQGVGSTFSFTVVFDVAQREDRVVSTGGMPSREAGDAHPDLSNLTLLVVEDDDINREVVCELLADEGITVLSAENGKVALERLKESHVDGVLMDCQMPVMDGYETAQAIRADGTYPDLPIIAMTGTTSMTDISKALGAGMNEHIAKPINPEKLINNLHHWFTAGKE